ncbi:MAG: family 43 glycosylhydrolase [Clostridia bacterium]|nr:family 43 glycosylhydrolase [Clostridia bacterium]
MAMEYCNPLNLDYKFQHYGRAAHREAADPTLILFKGTYYLFPSMCAGFYYSDDLASWKWHENRRLDMYNYAPDVRQISDYMVFTASSKGESSTIWRTKDPLSDQFEKVSAPFDFWDPAIFRDDDGRVYLYWGSSNDCPIYGWELDRETLTPIGERKSLIYGDKDHHGFERFNFPGKKEKERPGLEGEIYRLFFGAGNPFLEGPFMTKVNGKYYLQYAAPATEEAIYSDGYAVGDSPLGPFTFGINSPFSSRLSGFITAAGHGSTIEDRYGNLWHVASMGISVNADFERRVGLFPAGVDKEGLLFCNQNFADYPMEIPAGRFDPWSVRPKHMLLSYRKAVTASSSLEDHPPELAVDESIRTWWTARGNRGEWLQVDLGRPCPVHGVQINFAEEGIPVLRMPPEECGLPGPVGGRYVDSGHTLRTRYLLEGSADGQSWIPIADLRTADTDRTHPYHVLEQDQSLRYIRLTCAETPYNSPISVSGLRVFGLGDGEKPAKVTEGKSVMEDPMTCRLTWDRADGAMGYNVRFGVAPEKLYSSFQVYGQEEAYLTTLNAGVPYWYAIDAFNENGVTEGTVRKM